MLNMLAVEDNIIFAKTLINKVVQSNQQLRLCMIATDGEEAMNILGKEKIDIILLDLNLPKYSGIEILDFLQKNKRDEYIQSIIVVSGEMNMLEKIIGNPFVYSYIDKTQILDKVVKQVNEISKEKEFLSKKNNSKIIEKIDRELVNIGYNIKYLGTSYLADCIYLLYNSTNKRNIKLERDIYPIIAKNNNTTTNTIKCDIIRATKQVENIIDKQEIIKYFGYYIDKKIKPKLVISTILRKLEQET